jgi:hypothetical protein
MVYKTKIIMDNNNQDISKLIEASRSILQNKETAKQFLLEAGIIDQNGNLSENYRIDDEELDVAAKEYEQTRNDLDAVSDNQIVRRAFKAGAQWKEKQYDDFLTKGLVSAKGIAIQLAYEKGKSDMKQEMLKSAKQGTAQKDYQLILDDGTYIDLDPSMSLNPAIKVKEGQRVLVSIITE